MNEIGKNCRVVEPNHTYGYYREMAIHLNVKNWKEGDFPSTNDIFTIKNFTQHLGYNKGFVVYIENQNKEGFLIDQKGLIIMEDFIKEE